MGTAIYLPYVSSQNTGSYTRRICEMIYVDLWVYRGSNCEYTEVLTVSTRKEHKHMWVCAAWVLIQKVSVNICDIIYVYLWVYACTQKGSKCEHSQRHKHMWACTTWVHIHNHLYHDMNSLVNICIQRASKCEHSQRHKHIWVCTTLVHLQKVSVIW